MIDWDAEEKDLFERQGMDLLDRRDSDILVAEAEARGEVISKVATEAARVKYHSRHYAIAQRIEDLIGKLPQPGEQLAVITQGAFHMYPLLLHMLDRGKAQEIWIATFNMRGELAASLFGMLDTGQVQKLRIMISDSIRHRMPERIAQLRSLTERHAAAGFDCQTKLNWNHAKLMLVAIGADRFVVEGSGNFSDNAQIEQYRIDNSADLYDFHRGWMEREFQADRKKREETI
jgi:hypothetical protein